MVTTAASGKRDFLFRQIRRTVPGAIDLAIERNFANLAEQGANALAKTTNGRGAPLKPTQAVCAQKPSCRLFGANW